MPAPGFFHFGEHLLIRRSQRRSSLGLALALLVWAALALLGVREVGVVGEVAIGGALGRPPAVLVSLEPERWADGATEPTAGHRLGPLVASQVRPIERLELGGIALPLAINAYTGGIADWPARLLALLGGARWISALNLLLGGALIALVHRFLRFHADGLAASVAALLLATDAGFLFYRSALGGTELLLQAAGLLCLWSLWSRRWAGGRLAFFGFGVGVGLGLLAKATFAITLLALGLAALLTRWDRPAMRPPLPQRAGVALVAAAALLLPLAITFLHHRLYVPTDPHVLSHDFPDVQLRRVLSFLSLDRAPSRESFANLSYWAGDPYAFLGPAYQATEAPPAWSPWRVVAWVLLLAGVALSWRNRHPSPQEALTRFLSIYLPLQLGLLLLVARDLHHLAQATPTLALLGGLALTRLAATGTAALTIARLRNTVLLTLPWLWTGLHATLGADRALSSIPSPLFSESGQSSLIDLLRANHVERLVACDYELYGMLEIRAPEIHVEHAWAAASRTPDRASLLPALLRRAAGGHYLVVKPTAPMIYNLAPSRRAVEQAATAAGLVAEPIAALPQDRAVLYAVRDPG